MIRSALGELLSRKRLLIFDFDGTIVDSTPLHARAFNEAFAPEGIAVDYATIAGLKTDLAVDKVASEAGRSLDPERRAFIIADKRLRARRLVEEELVALPGSLEFIARATGRFAVALCTSGSRPTVEAALAKIGLTETFDPVITAEDVGRGKPEPEGFLKALHHHRLSQGEALVLEDAESGLAAAAAAGIEAVHVVVDASIEPPHRADWPLLNAALAEVLA